MIFSKSGTENDNYYSGCGFNNEEDEVVSMITICLEMNLSEMVLALDMTIILILNMILALYIILVLVVLSEMVLVLYSIMKKITL